VALNNIPGGPPGGLFYITVPLRDLSIVNYGPSGVGGVEVGQRLLPVPRVFNVTCPRTAEAVAPGAVLPALDTSTTPPAPAAVTVVRVAAVDYAAPLVEGEAAGGDGGGGADALVGAGDAPLSAGGGGGGGAPAPAAGATARAFSVLLTAPCGGGGGAPRTFACGPGMGGAVVTVACPKPVPAPTCLHYVAANNSWTTAGCVVARVDVTSILCACDRLADFGTRFAALDDAPPYVFVAPAPVLALRAVAPPAALYATLALLLAGALACGVGGGARADAAATARWAAALAAAPDVRFAVALREACGEEWVGDAVGGGGGGGSAKVGPALLEGGSGGDGAPTAVPAAVAALLPRRLRAAAAAAQALAAPPLPPPHPISAPEFAAAAARLAAAAGARAPPARTLAAPAAPPPWATLALHLAAAALRAETHGPTLLTLARCVACRPRRFVAASALGGCGGGHPVAAAHALLLALGAAAALYARAFGRAAGGVPAALAPAAASTAPLAPLAPAALAATAVAAAALAGAAAAALRAAGGEAARAAAAARFPSLTRELSRRAAFRRALAWAEWPEGGGGAPLLVHPFAAREVPDAPPPRGGAAALAAALFSGDGAPRAAPAPPPEPAAALAAWLLWGAAAPLRAPAALLPALFLPRASSQRVPLSTAWAAVEWELRFSPSAHSRHGRSALLAPLLGVALPWAAALFSAYYAALFGARNGAAAGASLLAAWAATVALYFCAAQPAAALARALLRAAPPALARAAAPGAAARALCCAPHRSRRPGAPLEALAELTLPAAGATSPRAAADAILAGAAAAALLDDARAGDAPPRDDDALGAALLYVALCLACAGAPPRWTPPQAAREGAGEPRRDARESAAAKSAAPRSGDGGEDVASVDDASSYGAPSSAAAPGSVPGAPSPEPVRAGAAAPVTSDAASVLSGFSGASEGGLITAGAARAWAARARYEGAAGTPAASGGGSAPLLRPLPLPPRARPPPLIAAAAGALRGAARGVLLRVPALLPPPGNAPRGAPRAAHFFPLGPRPEGAGGAFSPENQAAVRRAAAAARMLRAGAPPQPPPPSA
jgi:hypothetical protein